MDYENIADELRHMKTCRLYRYLVEDATKLNNTVQVMSELGKGLALVVK
jgi:hypothetical protein